jgi:ubiquinone/menaquinone biosynthesis C-methylase UbiE
LAFAQTLLLCAVFYAMIHYLDVFGGLLAIATFTFIILTAYIQHSENINIISAIARLFSLTGQNASQVFGLQIIVFLLLFSFLLILSAPVLYFNLSILEWGFSESDTWTKDVLDFLEAFMKLFGFYLTVPIVAATASYLYHSLKEIQTATNLKTMIEQVGSKTVKRRM